MPKPALLPDELAYLKAAAQIAYERAEEHTYPPRYTLAKVGPDEPSALLGWPWDKERCMRIADALDQAGCIEKSLLSKVGWTFRVTQIGFRVAGK